MVHEKKVDVSFSIPKKDPSAAMARAFSDLDGVYDDPAVGRVREGQILDVDYTKMVASVYILSDQTIKTAAIPGFMVNPTDGTGLWYGLQKGDVVHCHIGFGNMYYILNKVGNSVDSIQEKGISDDGIGSLFYNSVFAFQDTDLRNLEPTGFLFKCNNDIKIALSPSSGVFLGKQRNASFFLDAASLNGAQSGSSTLESNQSYIFNNGGYSVAGTVLRNTRIADLNYMNDANLDERIISRWYKNLMPVNFDPDLKQAEETTALRKRNPSFAENRSIVYEFTDYSYDNIIQSDDKEAKKQVLNAPQFLVDKRTSRRIRKEDVFSLSLISPNYLIEKIEGTAIDIYGNILDINRNILPIGEDEGFTTLNGTEENYRKIRELHRKSIAYHWELNARKDSDELDVESGTGAEYAVIERIYKRNRSRFFVDIDKEGQFKLNVPSSSKTGNVPVLARYENYSTINPKEKDDDYDYDYFQRSKDVSTDILLDSFGNGVIGLSGDEKLLPKDRITEQVIKVGTAFHDISTTCVVPLYVDDNHATGILSGPDLDVKDVDGTRFILAHTGGDSVVSKEIIINGENANAGGRSGTAVFDGMLNISVGANTIDRQSLWLDTQGGIVQRIGADLNGISLASQTDGDVYLQIGGQPLEDPNNGTPDRRFDEYARIDTSSKTNRLEIRVMQGNGPSYTRILIDGEGILICSPKNIEFRSEEDIVLGCNGNIFLNGEKIVPYGHTTKEDSSRVSRKVREFNEVFEADAGARPIQRGLERRT